jgi:hypothetical protein
MRTQHCGRNIVLKVKSYRAFPDFVDQAGLFWGGESTLSFFWCKTCGEIMLPSGRLDGPNLFMPTLDAIRAAGIAFDASLGH